MSNDILKMDDKWVEDAIAEKLQRETQKIYEEMRTPEEKQAIQAAQEHTKFILRCGRIIRMGHSAQRMLDSFLSDFFSSPQSRRTFLLDEHILSKTGFSRKIDIFRKICKQEGISEDALKPICVAFNFIKEKRDMVAHHEGYVDDPMNYKISLKKIKYSYGKEDMTEVTDELVNEVDKNLTFLHDRMWKITKEIDENFNKPKTL